MTYGVVSIQSFKKIDVHIYQYKFFDIYIYLYNKILPFYDKNELGKLYSCVL